MIKIILAMLLVFSAFPSYSSSNEQEWTVALKAMRNYCLAEVCLGMSVDDVSKLPGGTLTLWNSSRWERNCTGSYANGNSADFLTKDGTKLNVVFFDYPGSDDTNHRFRVRGVSSYLQVTPSEFKSLVEKISSRYSMRSTENKAAAPFDEWFTSGPHFDVLLSSNFRYIPKKSLISLYAKFDRYPDWMRAQLECAGQNRKLPNL